MGGTCNIPPDTKETILCVVRVAGLRVFTLRILLYYPPAPIISINQIKALAIISKAWREIHLSTLEG
jgi:hypothetical protein